MFYGKGPPTLNELTVQSARNFQWIVRLDSKTVRRTLDNKNRWLFQGFLYWFDRLRKWTKIPKNATKSKLKLQVV